MQRKRGKLWSALLLVCLLVCSFGITAAAETNTSEEKQNEYYFLSGQNENRMLIWEQKDIPPTIDAWIYDEENPDGIEKKDLKVTDVSISQQYEWGEVDREPLRENDERTLIRLEGSAEEGWYLEADEMGSIDLKVTFTEEASETSYTDTFRIDCVDEIYWVEWEFPNDKNTMLTYASCEVQTRVTRNYHDYENNENIYDVEVKDYKIIIENTWFDFEEEVEAENPSLFQAKVENHSISLTSNAWEGWGHLYIEVKDRDDNWLTGETLDMDVWSEYYDILPSEIKNPLLNKNLNLKALTGDDTLKLYQYNKKNLKGKYITDVAKEGYANNEGESISVATDETKTIRFRMSYSPGVFAPTSEQKEEGFISISNLTRISESGGNVLIVGEEYNDEDESWTEFVRRDYWFDYLDYYTGLNNASNNSSDTLFSDATAKFTLDKSNLEDKGDNYQITLTLGTYDGESDTFTKFDLDNSGKDKYFSYVYAEGSKEELEGIVLNGKKINEFYQAHRDAFRDDNWFDVHVQVTIDDNVVSNDYHGIEFRESFYSYDYPCSSPGEDMMLPTESIWINKTMHVYYENGECPYGNEADVEITNVSFAKEEELNKAVEGAEYCKPEGVSIKKQDDNWEIHGDEEGSAWITVTYKPVEGDTGLNYTCIRICVSSGYYRLDTSYTDGSRYMLPNSTKKIEVILTWRAIDEEGNITESKIPSEFYQPMLNLYENESGEEVPGYDTNLIDVTVSNATLTVTSKNEKWGTDIPLHVYMPDYGEINAYFSIEVCDEYYNIEPLQLQDKSGEGIIPAVGEEINILDDSYGIVLKRYNGDHPEGEEVEVKYTDKEMTASDDTNPKMRYRLEYDDWALEPTKETKNKDVPILKRVNEGGTWINLIAECFEEENWCEYTRRDYYIDGLPCLDSTRGGDNTWIYSNEDAYSLYLRGDVSNREGYSVAWNLYQWNEKTEKFDQQLDNSGDIYFTANDNKITLNGEELYKLCSDEADSVNLSLEYVIYASSDEENPREIMSDAVSINVRNPGYEYNYSYRCDDENEEDCVILLPGESITIDKVGTYYREDAEYPYGKREELDVKTKVESNTEDKTISFTDQGDRGWKVEALQTGNATIKVVYPKAKIDPNDTSAEGTGYIRIQVVDSYYGLLLENSEDSKNNYDFIQGSEFTYTAQYGKVTYKNGEYQVEKDSSVSYEWELTTDNGENITKYLEKEESKDSIKLKLKKNSGGDVTIAVKAVAKDSEGIKGEKTRYFYIYGNQYEYYDISMDEVVAAPGEKVNLSINVTRYTHENPEGVKVENPTLKIDMFDTNMFTLKGQEVTITADSLTEDDPVKKAEFRVRLVLDEENEEYWPTMLSLKVCKHKYEETSRTEATCVKEGVSHQVCKKCSAEKDVTLAKIAHNEVEDKAVAPTCTEAGLTKGSHCDVCKKVLVAQKKVVALGHDPVTTEGIKATCENTGKTAKTTCKRCQKTLTEEETIAALGHKTTTVITQATPKAAGSIVEKCTVCGKEIKKTVIASPKTVKFAKNGILTYNKKNQKAKVIAVYDAKGKVISAKNYKVSYPAKSKDIGRYKVQITLKGNYKGSLTVYYDIAPKGTAMQTVKAGAKSFTAKWKKQTSGTTGYLIQYSTDKKFTKGVKTVTVTKNKTVSAKVNKGIKGKTTYYVRVCTYKNVKYNRKTVKVCSAWSAAKSVKTKK